MKTIFSIIALGTVSLLSADHYASCPNGNCGMNYYNSQAGYQGQGYREQPQYQGQGQDYRGYRQQSQPQGQGTYYTQQDGYYQRSQDGTYNRNDEYNRNQTYAQYQRQDSQSNYDNTQKYNDDKGYYNPNKDYNQNNQYNDNRDNLNVSDNELNKEIKDLLAPGMFTKGYPDVRVEVRNGTVMLTGTVENLDDRAKLEDNIRNVKGVKQVNNQVTTRDKQASYGNSASYGTSTTRQSGNEGNINETSKNYSQDTASTEADRHLNARIREKISDGWFGRSYDVVTLRTNNGMVTLVGVVDSSDDVRKINDKLKEVDGIKSVNNQLSVKNK